MIKTGLGILFLIFFANYSFTQSFDNQMIELKKADALLNSKETIAANKRYQNIIQNFSKKNTADSTKAYVFSQYARSFDKQADWKNALKYAHQALAHYQKSLGERHLKTINEY